MVTREGRNMGLKNFWHHCPWGSAQREGAKKPAFFHGSGAAALFACSTCAGSCWSPFGLQPKAFESLLPSGQCWQLSGVSPADSASNSWGPHLLWWLASSAVSKWHGRTHTTWAHWSGSPPRNWCSHHLLSTCNKARPEDWSPGPCPWCSQGWKPARFQSPLPQAMAPSLQTSWLTKPQAGKPARPQNLSQTRPSGTCQSTPWHALDQEAASMRHPPGNQGQQRAREREEFGPSGLLTQMGQENSADTACRLSQGRVAKATAQTSAALLGHWALLPGKLQG